MFLQCILGASIRRRHESVWVYDAFGEDESVSFGTCDDSEMFGGWIPPQEVGVYLIDVTSLVERLCHLIDQILTHDVIVKLLGSPYIEGEPSHFATYFALTGLVAVILGTRGGDLCDAVAVIEFVRHLS